jgi:hypothetical protein
MLLSNRGTCREKIGDRTFTSIFFYISMLNPCSFENYCLVFNLNLHVLNLLLITYLLHLFYFFDAYLIKLSKGEKVLICARFYRAKSKPASL